MKPLTLLSIITLSLTACMAETPYNPPTPPPPGLDNGYLAGDFGPQTGIGGEAAITGEDNLEMRQVVLRLTHQEVPDGRVGMMIFEANDQNLKDFPLGHHTFFNNPDTLDDQPVVAFVCSGDDDSLNFDKQADRLEMEVGQIEGGRSYTLQTLTTFEPSEPPQIGSASFDVFD